jgi:hypothetical protein
MKPFIFKHWHAWQNTQNRIVLSDESTKRLFDFPSPDACVNWLYMQQEQPAARALNSHIKEGDA